MSRSSVRVFLDRIMAEEEFSLQLAADLSRKRMELVREAWRMLRRRALALSFTRFLGRFQSCALQCD